MTPLSPTGPAPSPVAVPAEIVVRPGPALLAGVRRGPGLAEHRAQHGPLPRVGVEELAAVAERVRLRGRGGAAFPFAIKLRAAAAGRSPVVVVNLSEGEPASAKDTALALARPHLVLDGALVAAYALRARELHLVLPRERPGVAAAVRAALAERSERVRVAVHTTGGRFVGGQARAVLELMAGRDNLPVTAWAPEAVSGHRGRPTLLSNAETWAQLGLLVLHGEAAYAAHGTPTEPGTTLLTLSGPVPEVVEAPFGTPLGDLLPAPWRGRPLLLGGFHGSWVDGATGAGATVSVDELSARGTPLGAGVVLCPEGCPVRFTSAVVAYLAGQSAGRCGPCRNGLPALAGAVRAVADGRGGTGPVEELAALVHGRGACAHPDGTVRLVRSMLATFPLHTAEHAAGSGPCGGPADRLLEAAR